MNTSDLIQPRHLQRRAEIYIRQSSPNQVITNLESQRLQYALRERAITLGWHEQDVHVIDVDLGRSGAITEGDHRHPSFFGDHRHPSFFGVLSIFLSQTPS